MSQSKEFKLGILYHFCQEQQTKQWRKVSTQETVLELHTCKKTKLNYRDITQSSY